MTTTDYYRYWGKASSDTDSGSRFHLLVYHCLDVAAVGDVLLRRHPALFRTLAIQTGVPGRLLHGWILHLLAVHDIGKFSEAFQRLLPELRTHLVGEAGDREYRVRHDSLGYVLWRRRLRRRWRRESAGSRPAPLEDAYDIAMAAVTGHHGVPPQLAEGDRRYRLAEHFAEQDVCAAERFFEAARNLFAPDWDELSQLFAGVGCLFHLRRGSWWLAGLAVLCDWIGSDNRIFRYDDGAPTPRELVDYWRQVAGPRAEEAVARSGILPAPPGTFVSFEALFPELAESPSPLQSLCATVALGTGPQLWILEDVTGAGKTEAAITLTHRLMSGGYGTGFYVGLPTMATANAMFDRMASLYTRLFERGAKPSVSLAHGARHLLREYREAVLPHDSVDQNYANDESSASAQCAEWIADHRKRALLAEVGIGTVDQALLGVLASRHQSLRLLGLAGKVLILDEVHAYDAYVSRLIQTLLRFHAAGGGSAILLSATLPVSTRQGLVEAYLSGLNGRDCAASENGTGYPAVTTVDASSGTHWEVGIRPGTERRLPVALLHDTDSVMRVVESAASTGRCVCWVRNSVDDATQAYLELAERECISRENLTLFHSRFALIDRLRIERQVLNCFGKTSGSRIRAGRVLVATQVVEQSLDLDFDVMVTDLAPIDLVIQRAGRLRRHSRDADGNRNPAGRVEERESVPLYVLSPPAGENADGAWVRNLLPKTASVYPHAGVLWRTARLLSAAGELVLPADARALIERVYGDDEAEPLPEALAEEVWRAVGEDLAVFGMAAHNALELTTGYCFAGPWVEELQARTRLSEDSVELALAVRHGGGVQSYAGGEYGWDLSIVRVPRRLLGEGEMQGFAEAPGEVARIRAEQPGLSFKTLVCLHRSAIGSWEGTVVDSRGRETRLAYDQRIGLKLETFSSRRPGRPPRAAPRERGTQ